MFLNLVLFSNSKENTVIYLCTKLCGKQLHREYFTSYYFEIIAGLVQGFWAVKTAVAHVTRGRELSNATRGTWNFWNFSVSKVSELLENPLALFTWHSFFRVWLICLIKVIFFIWILVALCLDFSMGTWAAEGDREHWEGQLSLGCLNSPSEYWGQLEVTFLWPNLTQQVVGVRLMVPVILNTEKYTNNFSPYTISGTQTMRKKKVWFYWHR